MDLLYYINFCFSCIQLFLIFLYTVSVYLSQASNFFLAGSICSVAYEALTLFVRQLQEGLKPLLSGFQGYLVDDGCKILPAPYPFRQSYSQR